MILEAIPVMITFGCLNRARGSKLFDLTDSTMLARLVACTGMGLVMMSLFLPDSLTMCLAFSWTLASLMLWCVPAWDKFWSAAIGNPTNISKPAFAPVDWIMARLKLSVVPNWRLRVWGLIAMSLRQTLAMPFLIGLALLAGEPWHIIYALGAPLVGLIYYLSGYLYPRNPIPVAEVAGGVWLGLLGCLVLAG